MRRLRYHDMGLNGILKMQHFVAKFGMKRPTSIADAVQCVQEVKVIRPHAVTQEVWWSWSQPLGSTQDQKNRPRCKIEEKAPTSFLDIQRRLYTRGRKLLDGRVHFIESEDETEASVMAILK
jgi:hypothetical protein